MGNVRCPQPWQAGASPDVSMNNLSLRDLFHGIFQQTTFDDTFDGNFLGVIFNWLVVEPMKVSWDYCSQYMEEKQMSKPPTSQCFYMDLCFEDGFPTLTSHDLQKV